MPTNHRPERTAIIPGMLGDSPHRPRAATLQRNVETTDNILVNLARAKHPTVAWWWGVRTIDGIKSAWCYLCDQVIVQGALNVGITEAQQGEVDAHKREHWQDAKAAATDKAPF